MSQVLVEAIPFYEQPGGIHVRVLWDMADYDRFNEIIEYAARPLPCGSRRWA